MSCSLRSLPLFLSLVCLAACGGGSAVGGGGTPPASPDAATSPGPVGPPPSTGGTGGTGGAPGADAAVVVATDASVVPPAADARPAADGAAPPAGEGGARSRDPVPSAACGGMAMVPGPTGNQTIMANGKSRTFIIRMVNGYDGKRPVPVMFAFHGAGGGAAGFASGTFAGLDKMAAEKAIRVYPQAFDGNTWSRDEDDDVMFMDAIIAWLGTHVCYDTARVFATGQSSGSYFSHRFACDRGNIVRAVGTSSGGQRKERPLDCKVPVSAWLSNGASDKAGHVMGTQQARDIWLKLAGCSLTGATPVPPAPCVSYPGCRPGYAVNYCQHPGGHAFPGYAATGIFNFLFNNPNI